jgi:hypothetical protein
MTTWLPALLIGAVLGYGVIYLREVGLVLAVIVTAGLMVVYARQGRLRDIGLLMVAEGVWPSFVASWSLWREATRVDTEASPETVLFLVGGLMLVLGGLAIVASRKRSPRT